MYLISSPISNKGIEQIKTFVDELEINPKIIRIYIDLQNISVGKYYDDNVKEIYSKMDEYQVSSMIYYELINFLGTKLDKFRKTFNTNEIYFYLYSDESRNKLNEIFIPTWKENRRKSWVQAKEKDVSLYEAASWISQIMKATVKSASEFIGKSPHCKVCMLRYVDSDFVPYVWILLDELLRSDKNDILHLIVSNDHDYIHCVESSNLNVFRYFFLQNNKNTIVEHRFNIYNRVKSKFNLKTLTIDDYKHVSKYYQIYHALLGDPGDGFGTLVPRKGLKYWISLKEEVNKHDINYWREYILDHDEFPGIPEEHFKEFRNRLLVVDFFYFSLLVSKPFLSKDMIPLYEKVLKFLPIEGREIININVDIMKNILGQSEFMKKEDVEYILNYFKVKDSKRLAESLWY